MKYLSYLWNDYRFWLFISAIALLEFIISLIKYLKSNHVKPKKLSDSGVYALGFFLLSFILAMIIVFVL